MDTCWPECAENDYIITININKGATRREVMAKIHHHVAALTRVLNFQSLVEHVGALESVTTKAAFLQRCDDVKLSIDDMDGLGLQEPARARINLTAKRRKVEDVCRQVIDNFRKAKDAEKKKTREEERQGAGDQNKS